MRILGLDLGAKRIGVALSDELEICATPLTFIKKSSIGKDIEEVLKLVAEHSVGLIVTGMPLNMDGTAGAAAASVNKFIDHLKNKTDLPVETWDERLSTVAVTRVLIEGDTSRAKRKKLVDKLSASYILQGYLDRRKGA